MLVRPPVPDTLGWQCCWAVLGTGVRVRGCGSGHAERMSEIPPTPRRPPTAMDRAFLTDAEELTELILVRHGQQVWPDPVSSTV